MLARVAENIYWLSRYLERAENTVRLVDVHSAMLLDLPDVDDHSGWIPVIRINALDKEFAKKHNKASESNVCHFLLADEDNDGSLLNAFVAIQNNLRSCRDIIPRSSYEAINGACRHIREHVNKATSNPTKRNEFMREMQRRLQAISGDISSNMSHDIAYRFMRMGCIIERADMTSRIIDVQSSTLLTSKTGQENMALQQQRWVAVLRSLSAMQMYRQHIRRPVSGPDTLSFLLLNERLPRAYMYCINNLADTLRPFRQHAGPLAAIEALREQLDTADLTRLAEQPLQLHEYIDQLQLGMQAVAQGISDTYFLPPQDN